MLLSSTDIRKYLEEGTLKIVVEKEHNIDPYQHIRPCSIDIHLSKNFWKFKKTSQPLDILDLNNIEEFKNSQNLFCDHIILATNAEYLEIEPGQIILTHTLEWLELPTFISGSLKGRSSFARLGISIHCTGDFINPGYKGYMPMQLINHNPFPVRVYPFVSMAQLTFSLVSSEPDISYQNLPSSIYKFDDVDDATNRGSLSFWFRDFEIKRIAHRISDNKNIRKNTELLIQEAIKNSEDRTLEQIELLVDKNQNFPEKITEKLRNFESKDVKRERKMRLFFWIFTLVAGADLSIFIPELIKLISTGNSQEPAFWISFLILAFSVLILWITFDIKFIGF